MVRICAGLTAWPEAIKSNNLHRETITAGKNFLVSAFVMGGNLHGRSIYINLSG